MRSWPALLAAAALTLALSACGDDEADPDADPDADDSPSASSTPTPTPSPTASQTQVEETPSPTEEPGQTVAITIEGDQVTPRGDRLEVDRDEVVTLEITSDRAGELHVHGKPEQYVEFGAGSSTHELVISAPGVVDVEDHETGLVIVQLEVQ